MILGLVFGFRYVFFPVSSMVSVSVVVSILVSVFFFSACCFFFVFHCLPFPSPPVIKSERACDQSSPWRKKYNIDLYVAAFALLLRLPLLAVSLWRVGVAFLPFTQQA